MINTLNYIYREKIGLTLIYQLITSLTLIYFNY